MAPADHSVTIGEIDPDPFYDFTQQRPHVSVDDDVREIVWPANEFVLQRNPGHRDVVALIGVERGDGVALAHNVLQQLALSSFPQCNALAHASVQRPKIMLDLTKIGQQFTRNHHELLEAVLQCGVVQ